ncbi:hypothetical protein MRX96_020780 [Rhipicephalus microplus]
MNAKTDVSVQRRSPHSSRTSSLTPRKSSDTKKPSEPAGQQGPLDESLRAAPSASESPADGDSSHAPRRSDSIRSWVLAHMHDLALQSEEDQHCSGVFTWRHAAVVALRSWARNMAPLCVLALTVFALVAYFVISSIVRKPHPDALQIESCMSRDCIDHMARLSNELNTSVDACWDPVGYVCGQCTLGQLPRIGRVLPTCLRAGTMTAPHFSNSEDILGTITLHALANFIAHKVMRSRGLPWPRRSTGPDSGKDALDVLLDLLIRWGVTSVMELSIMKLPGDTRYSLYMSFNHITVRRASWYNYSKVDGRRIKNVQAMYHLYGASDTPLAQVRDLVTDEEKISPHRHLRSL